MSLQRYRSQLAIKQNRGLWLYFFGAVGVHAAGLWVGYANQWFEQKTPQSQLPMPIEFVNVEPSPAQQPPQATERRAQTDAVAGRNPNRERTPQTGQTNVQAPSFPTPLIPSAPAIPLRPQPVLPSIPPIPPLPSPQISSPQPALRQTPQTAAINSISPSPSRFAAPPTEPLPSSAPNLPFTVSEERPLAAQPNSPAAALGNSLTASAALEGQGLTGQLNPNRVGNGASVDAVQDNVWGNYLSMLNQAVNQNWRRVSVAATRRTRIRFRVDRLGNLTDLRLVQPSGDTAADEAAIQAVRASAPFAPLPQNASEEVLIVNFTFTQW